MQIKNRGCKIEFLFLFDQCVLFCISPIHTESLNYEMLLHFVLFAICISMLDQIFIKLFLQIWTHERDKFNNTSFRHSMSFPINFY